MAIIDTRLSDKFEVEEDYYTQRDDEYHISSIGKCPRFLFLERTQRRKDSFKNKRIFILGKIIHEWIQNNIFKDYIQEEQLEYINNGVKFVGRIDLHNNNEIIELKSCSNTSYLLEPYEEHKVQVNSYMGIKGIKKAQIVYINKTDFSTISFDLPFSQELFDNSVKNIIKLNNQIKSKADYKDIGQKIGFGCKYCKYADLCNFKNAKQSSLSNT